MIAEIDPCSGGGQFDHFGENIVKRFTRQQIGDHGGDTAHGCCCGLGFGIPFVARTRNIRTMAEMKMRIDSAGQHNQSVGPDFLCGGAEFSGTENGGDAAVPDGNIAARQCVTGQHRLPAADDQVEWGHENSPFDACGGQPMAINADKASFVETTSAYLDAMSNRLTACEVRLRS